MRPARRRKRDRQSLPASAARKGTSHSSSRLERSLGIQLVIAPVPLKAPAAAYNGARPHHTTYRATWDNGISLKPSLDPWMLVGRIIIGDAVNIQLLRRCSIDSFQEFEELLVTVPRHTLADNLAFQDIERGK